jgi:hypothetical protein
LGGEDVRVELHELHRGKGRFWIEMGIASFSDSAIIWQ